MSKTLLIKSAGKVTLKNPAFPRYQVISGLSLKDWFLLIKKRRGWIYRRLMDDVTYGNSECRVLVLKVVVERRVVNWRPFFFGIGHASTRMSYGSIKRVY